MRNSMPPAADGVDLMQHISANEFGKLQWFDWWYTLSSPAKPDESASFKQREDYRRALLASVLLCLMLALLLCALLVSIVSMNLTNVVVAAGVIVFLLIAIGFNRAGMLIAEGFLVVGLWTVGEALTFLVQPSLDISNVMQYDLLNVGILLAIAFFPPWSAFVVGLLNGIFIWLSLVSMKHTPQLAQFLQHDGIGRVLIRPISLMIVVMVVTYLWSRSGHHALRRADRAEMINKLQYQLKKSTMAMADQKAQVDQSVQNISYALSTYANGNPTVRVPLTQNNMLWNISGPINNMLNRMQRLRQVELELEQIRPLFYKLERENAALRMLLQKQGEPYP